MAARARDHNQAGGCWRVRVVAVAVLAVTAIGAREAGAPLAGLADGGLSAMRANDRAMIERLGGHLVASRGAWLQATTTDCGVAVVREALRGLPGPAVPPRDSIARLAGTSAAGTSLDGLARALDALGVAARRSDGVLVASNAAPYIAHFRVGHFVLVRRIAGDTAWLFDPLVGEVRIGLREFSGLWSGAGLVVGGQAGLARGRVRTSADADDGHSAED